MGEIDYLDYIKKYIRFSKIHAFTAIIVSVLVLIGWLTDNTFLKRLYSNGSFTNPFAAVLFILIALSIIFYKKDDPIRIRRVSFRLLVVCIFTIGIVGLLSLILNSPGVFDSVIFADKIAAQVDSGLNTIIVTTFLGFILLGGSLILIYFNKYHRASNVLSFAGLMLGWLGILGKLYDVKVPFNGTALNTPLAFSSSLAIFFCAFGILNMRPEEGFVKRILNDDIAGSTLRLLISTTFILIGALGYFGLGGVNAGSYPNDLGVLYFVVLNSVILLVIFYLTGIVISNEEVKRKAADNIIVTKTFELEKNKIDLEKNLKELENTKTAVLNILEDLQVERDVAAKERDKVDAILQSIGDAVFVVDADYKITVFNKVAEELSGVSAKDAMGKHYTESLKFIFEDTKKENDKFIKESIETGSITSMTNHTILINKEGKEIPVSDSAAALKDSEGKVVGCVVVFRDITKEREVDKAKTEFVSLASHQLRTPLSAINWYSEMLTDGDAGKVNKQQQEFLNEIHTGSQRMVALVNALLNVSRIDVGTFAIDPKPTDIVEVAKSLVKEMEVTIKQKDLNIKEKYDDIPETMLDPNLIRIVIQNILSNAIKYTDPKKNISISITKDTKDIKMEISDEGYGIPKEQQEKIFQKLFRADNVRQKDVEGTGLGLYIVKSIVETSGGTIRFESIENKGTTFFITIPLSGMKKKEGTKDLSA